MFQNPSRNHVGRGGSFPILSLFVLLAITSVMFLAGCTSVPVDPTPKQQVVANAVEDTMAIGLVPVLTKNRDYIPAAAAVAGTLGSFSGDTISPADVDAVLAKCGVTGEDAAVIAGMVNAAWETYSLRYAQQVNASVRPDVKLFLSAISNGIRRAIAAVPKQSVSLYIKSDMQHTISFQ